MPPHSSGIDPLNSFESEEKNKCKISVFVFKYWVDLFTHLRINKLVHPTNPVLMAEGQLVSFGTVESL